MTMISSEVQECRRGPGSATPPPARSGPEAAHRSPRSTGPLPQERGGRRITSGTRYQQQTGDHVDDQHRNRHRRADLRVDQGDQGEGGAGDEQRAWRLALHHSHPIRVSARMVSRQPVHTPSCRACALSLSEASGCRAARRELLGPVPIATAEGLQLVVPHARGRRGCPGRSRLRPARRSHGRPPVTSSERHHHIDVRGELRLRGCGGGASGSGVGKRVDLGEHRVRRLPAHPRDQSGQPVQLVRHEDITGAPGLLATPPLPLGILREERTPGRGLGAWTRSPGLRSAARAPAGRHRPSPNRRRSSCSSGPSADGSPRSTVAAPGSRPLTSTTTRTCAGEITPRSGEPANARADQPADGPCRADPGRSTVGVGLPTATMGLTPIEATTTRQARAVGGR